MSIQNSEKRQKLMTKFLKNLGVKVDGRRIVIQRNDFVFEFHMFQTNITVFLPQCFDCPLDCTKYIELYLGETPHPRIEIPAKLEPADLLLLAQVKDILANNYPLDTEVLKTKIKRRLHILKFGLIGFDQVGKSTLFESIPGTPKRVENLIQTYTKEITSFPPLKIKLYDYGTHIMENLISKSPAPLLLEHLRNFYLYIIVTDSSSQNVLGIKTHILPKLKRLSPYAAFIVVANKQDLPNRISPQLIEKILGMQTYPFSAHGPESQEILTKLINDIILLRIGQMR
ncbi:MAG: ADP-ribosylation factor-like protein, partial [Candidatus Helarchaeota archaeon]